MISTKNTIRLLITILILYVLLKIKTYCVEVFRDLYHNLNERDHRKTMANVFIYVDLYSSLTLKFKSQIYFETNSKL